MRIGIISDTHADTWKSCGASLEYEYGNVDFILYAGDAGNGDSWYTGVVKKLENTFGVPVYATKGNHCHYGSSEFHKPRLFVHDGIKIATAPLWTNFRGLDSSHPLVQHAVESISDFNRIPNFTADKCIDLYNQHDEFIRSSGADIVMTHFPMFIQSCHPMYAGDPLNVYFVNDSLPIDGVRLYVHGHTHHAFDYMIDDALVVCNPLGYPAENTNTPFVQMKVVDFE